MSHSSNKRIAKNTMFLYFRMFFIMAISFYTSRVILDRLGVDDYGLYNAVGGVVGMLSFLSGTLSIGTTRYITYALGTDDEKSVKDTFCTSFYAHLGLALLMILLLETVGQWFVYTKLNIPDDRFKAAIWVFHISILTMLVNVTQVPYTALVMAHERMGIYAYVSIFEGIAKLVICYLIACSPLDKLTFYAILLALVQVIVAMLYRVYCNVKFRESHLSRSFDRSIFRSMMGFSGWNILANVVETLKLQGVIVLMNMFFAPAIVGAQAFANNLSASMMQFVNNFRTAINPQIIKLYAAGEYEKSRRLTLSTTVYVFDLILLLGLPCLFAMPKILELWLVEVPDYTVVFCQFVIAYNILSTFSAAFYIPMMAAGKIRTNSLAGLFFGICQFVVLYFILRLGGGVMWMQYFIISIALAFSFIVKPWILVREVGYRYSEILRCFLTCTKVAVASLVLPILCLCLMDRDALSHNILLVLCTVVSVGCASLLFMEREVRAKLYGFIRAKL